MLGPDSYGIVFLFLVGDYVFLAVGWTGRLSVIVTAIWLGLTVLLAFRTSEVPHRLMLVVRVAVAVTVVAAVVVAFGGGNRAYGTIVILCVAAGAGEPDRYRLARPAPQARSRRRPFSGRCASTS